MVFRVIFIRMRTGTRFRFHLLVMLFIRLNALPYSTYILNDNFRFLRHLLPAAAFGCHLLGKFTLCKMSNQHHRERDLPFQKSLKVP